MSISGSLKTMLAGDLLQWCGSNLKTGTLRLRNGPIEKQLFFNGGRLFSSTSNSPRETLGQFLIRSGKITEEELFRALIHQDRHKLPLGQILIKEDLLSENELKDLLRLKTEETIYDCFLWSDGEFIFEDGVLPEDIPVSLPLDLTGVILEGARRTDEWRRIREVFPSRFTSFTVNTSTVSEAKDRSGEDLRILEWIDQGKNLVEIALEMHAVDFYAASRLLELYQRGLVSVANVPEELPFEQQVEKLHADLREGVVCFNAGEYAEALRFFEAALDIDPHNKHARLFHIQTKRIIDEAEVISQIPLDKVPALKCSMQELGQMTLSPQEGFVLSRVNGQWDVRSILKICPMSETEVISIFKRLLDEGLIELI